MKDVLRELGEYLGLMPTEGEGPDALPTPLYAVLAGFLLFCFVVAALQPAAQQDLSCWRWAVSRRSASGPGWTGGDLKDQLSRVASWLCPSPPRFPPAPYRQPGPAVRPPAPAHPGPGPLGMDGRGGARRRPPRPREARRGPLRAPRPHEAGGPGRGAGALLPAGRHRHRGRQPKRQRRWDRRRDNAQGNVAGLMPHPEHAVDALLGSTDGQALLAAASPRSWPDPNEPPQREQRSNGETGCGRPEPEPLQRPQWDSPGGYPPDECEGDEPKDEEQQRGTSTPECHPVREDGEKYADDQRDRQCSNKPSDRHLAVSRGWIRPADRPQAAEYGLQIRCRDHRHRAPAPSGLPVGSGFRPEHCSRPLAWLAKLACAPYGGDCEHRGDGAIG